MAAPWEKAKLFDQVLTQNEGRFRFLARQSASAGEAEDLYQEILCQIWKGLDCFEGRSGATTWAYRTALNTASTYKRNNFRRGRALREFDQNAQPEQMCGRGEEQILREFTQSLPDEERTLFALYLANKSYQEIAEAEGISEIARRVKICRLRNQFKQRYL